MPVRLHAPISPSATSCSNTGRTCERNSDSDVETADISLVPHRMPVRHQVRMQEENIEPVTP